MKPVMNLPLRGAPVAMIDFETTGIDPWSCEPLEVAVVHFNLGTTKPQVVYRTLIRPTGPIPEGATKVHGITDEQAATGRELEAVGRDLASWMHGRVPAAYNLPYDWPLLFRAIQTAGWSCPSFIGGLDPMVWYRQIRGKLSGRLTDACRDFGVRFEGEAHAASADALAAARLIPVLLDQLADDDHLSEGMTVSDMWQLTNRWALEQADTLAAWLRSKGRVEDGAWSKCLAATTPVPMEGADAPE